MSMLNKHLHACSESPAFKLTSTYLIGERACSLQMRASFDMPPETLVAKDLYHDGLRVRSKDMIFVWWAEQTIVAKAVCFLESSSSFYIAAQLYNHDRDNQWIATANVAIVNIRALQMVAIWAPTARGLIALRPHALRPGCA